MHSPRSCRFGDLMDSIIMDSNMDNTANTANTANMGESRGNAWGQGKRG